MSGKDPKTTARPAGVRKQESLMMGGLDASDINDMEKAHSLLDEIEYWMNLYELSASHYERNHKLLFMIPSILITAASSFLSFYATSGSCEFMKNSAFLTGFLASLASIVTGLSSSYKYDVKAEAYRSGAVEYRLLSTRITAILRREETDDSAWDKLWSEIEERTTDLQKKVQHNPPYSLIQAWKKTGILSTKTKSKSGMIPPWLIPYRKALNQDGIQDDSDFRYIQDFQFIEWMDNERYPDVVLEKMKAKRDADRKGGNRPEDKLKKALGGVGFKSTTTDMLRRHGISTVKDLRLLDDISMDSIIDDLLLAGNAPKMIAWKALEEMVVEVKSFGCLLNGTAKMVKMIVTKVAALAGKDLEIPNPGRDARLEKLEQFVLKRRAEGKSSVSASGDDVAGSRNDTRRSRASKEM